MDLLRYSGTPVEMCLANRPLQEIHDILRQAFVHPTRLVICGCVTDVWIRKTLAFLEVRLHNEPSGKHLGSNTH